MVFRTNPNSFRFVNFGSRIEKTRSTILRGLIAVLLGTLALPLQAGEQATSTNLKSEAAVALEVDRLIDTTLEKANVTPADLTNDEDFLRRVSFDLTGMAPTPNQVTLFGLDPDPRKRFKLIDRLVASDANATNWASYWRDVIYSRATDARAVRYQPVFERWLANQFRQNAGWDEIATEMLTASGDVIENGATALMMAHMGEATEIASETSRIFLGIQIQCANCHNHPTDQWQRADFHELAAFFPRVRVRPKPNATPRSFEVTSLDIEPRRNNVYNPERLFRFIDRNHDDKITKAEADRSERFKPIFERLASVADTNKDGAISLDELKSAPRPQNANRGRTEYYMPDLNDPSSEGTLVQPAFFVNNAKPRQGLRDADRRDVLASYITDRNNPWFAKAYVNRIWAEMLGEGFYTPVDDMGPERFAQYEEVLELLAQSFAENDYDVRWLFRTIARTKAYQREIRPRDTSGNTPAFASAVPTRLRSDQIYNALATVSGRDPSATSGAQAYRGRNTSLRNPKALFSQTFGFDPSTPQEDITGDIPQSLFMMNSSQIRDITRSSAGTPLARILRENSIDRDAVDELYLLALSRYPSKQEQEICRTYIAEAGSRNEAFEDLLWSLINSAEFITKR